MPTTLVFDVLIDTISPVRARAGQVLVVRGESAVVVRRGGTTPLSDGVVTPSALTALISQGVVQRRTPERRQQAG